VLSQHLLYGSQYTDCEEHLLTRKNQKRSSRRPLIPKGSTHTHTVNTGELFIFPDFENRNSLQGILKYEGGV